ncbi:MAG: cytochrome c [Burkholderiales bacterium]|nr:cytochrome c [Burkholderiales bacterium]
MRHPTLLVFAALGAAAPALAQSPAAGEAKSLRTTIAMCEGCHGIPGYRTAYPEVYHVPKLGGQSAAYLAAALAAYKSGQRRHPSMRGIAAGLSEKEIAEIAAYYAGGAK